MRSGDTFAAYYATTTETPTSADWTLVGSHTLAMSALTAGLSVTAVDNSTLCTATFTGVSVTGQWVQTTAADFNAGSNRGTTVTNTAGGEVHLAASALRGIFTSATFDAGRVAEWGALSWTADVPAGTTLVVETRSGDTAAPETRAGRPGRPLPRVSRCPVQAPATFSTAWYCASRAPTCRPYCTTLRSFGRETAHALKRGSASP